MSNQDVTTRSPRAGLALFCALAATSVLLAALQIYGQLNSESGIVKFSDSKSATAALGMMKDWGMWMAGIQTAMLATLGVMAKDDALISKLERHQLWLLIFAAVFITAALFFSAWLLTATSSIMLRLVDKIPLGDTPQHHDFYKFALFYFQEGTPIGKRVTVEYIAVCDHWLWAAGILTFGSLVVSIFVSRASACPVSKPSMTMVRVPDGWMLVEKRAAHPAETTPFVAHRETV